MSFLRQTAGSLKTRLYRNPRDFVRKLRAWGLTNYVCASRWENEMRTAVADLPRLDLPTWDLEVCFLTGTRFWHQTAFCAWTLQRHAGLTPGLQIFDDGSLRESEIAALARLFPALKVHTASGMEALIDEVLPVAQFPRLRRKRSEYPNIRKLIDVHVGSKGPKLVLDSDMLFFGPPREITDWAKGPDRILHMSERIQSYGYPDNALKMLCGQPLPRGLNVGVTGLLSESLPWQTLETWTGTLISQHGESYYLEQALIAMLAAIQPATGLPAERYLVMPGAAEARQPTAILHHYVDNTRPFLFRWGWHHVVNSAKS